MSLSTIYNKNGAPCGVVHIPSVMQNSPIRPDVVRFVHDNLAKNKIQPYSRFNRAGHQHSAESWGTGRAVARVPRISGSGTSRNGQGAFANMVRGGRMFSPIKIWRRWHRLVNISQRRYAISAALAASSVPALVMARGHKIDNVPEIPLVVSDEVERIKKTKEAVAILKAIKASDDVQRSADSRKIRAGKGKMRNRRYVQRKGALIIHNKEEGLSRAFRNISGVNIANVNRLNIRDLAPGGHLGRFIIWTEGAYKKLDTIFGTAHRDALLKKGYRHPMSPMTTSDLNRIIYSSKVQAAIRPKASRLPRVPKTRKNLLLVRKIRRQTIVNSKVLQDRKARLDKLRAAGKLPAKKEKGPVTKRKERVDIFGKPLSKAAKKAAYKKAKAERKAKKGEEKKTRLERTARKIAQAKAKKLELKKALAAKAEAKKKADENKKPKKKRLSKTELKKLAESRPKPKSKKQQVVPKVNLSHNKIIKKKIAALKVKRAEYAKKHPKVEKAKTAPQQSK